MNKELQKNKDVAEFYDAVKRRLFDGDVPLNAARLAYADLCRTLRGFGKNDEKQNIKNEIFSLLKNEYENLTKSRLESAEAFDEWHRMLCDKMKLIFADKHKFTYGQAQKWINMFLKYMLLADERLNGMLLWLHIPIDRIITAELKKRRCCDYLKPYITNEFETWSVIDDYDSYIVLQRKCRELFDSPILTEFRFWNEGKAPNHVG